MSGVELELLSTEAWLALQTLSSLSLSGLTAFLWPQGIPRKLIKVTTSKGATTITQLKPTRALKQGSMINPILRMGKLRLSGLPLSPPTKEMRSQLC